MRLCRTIRRLLPFIGVLAFLLACTPSAHAATPDEIEEAIKKAKKFLYSRQNSDGNWEAVPAPINKFESDVNGRQWGGQTAIATYALLAAGENHNEPRIQKAVEFLKNADLEGIYAVSLRCQVWLLLGDSKSLGPELRRDYELLMRDMYTTGPHAGMFTYYYEGGPQPKNYFDHSVSQYGVLGFWALEQAGLDIPSGTWRMIDQSWRKDQNVDGGWSYQSTSSANSPSHATSTASMTAAGVATLFITGDYLQTDPGNCKTKLTNENIERGLKWMDAHADRALDPNNTYTMYGVERIGVASGRKYFGTVGWYDGGADALVKNQRNDGDWGDVPHTAFALLFLVRGRAPVMMSKLQYRVAGLANTTYEGGWNERPRDVANFARYMSHNLERDLNWQIVNLNVSPDDLHDAPILYIAGSEALRMPAEDVEHLREFVEGGGMILGNADCAKREFADSFVQLGQKMFPNYRFRELEPDHPIFTRQQFPASNWKQRPSVLGLSNGVREMMLLVPETDLGHAWQGRLEKQRESEYQLGADIYVYATDKRNPRYKGESPAIRLNPEIQGERMLNIARIEVGENWDPEPGGWRRMAALMHNDYRVDLNVRPVKLGEQNLRGANVAHLTGTTQFAFSEIQRKMIRDFVDRGGILVIDAAGGWQAFAESAAGELKTLFPEEAAKGLSSPLLPFHGLYTMSEAPIHEFAYRSFARGSLVGDAKSPHIFGIEHKGRLAIFFSREDLSAGLVGEWVDGVRGYTPEVATAIMRNILLYAAKSPTPTTARTSRPTTRPTTRPATQPIATTTRGK